MEQYVRDARINTIYEGTNGIQSLDLLGRKVLLDGGVKLGRLGTIVKTFIEEQGNDDAMAPFIAPLRALVGRVESLTMDLAVKAQASADEVGAASVDYLRLIGHLVYGYFWARMAKLALEQEAAKDPFYTSKLATARFYFGRLLPETEALYLSASSGASNLLDLQADLF
jgi:hypothetical protein